MRRAILSAIWGASLLVMPVIAESAEVHGRSSTQLLWYNDIVDASKQMDLAEYLRISVTGIDEAGNLSLKGYGRVIWDVKDVEAGEDRVEERLYYLYADIKNIVAKTDFRLGRQFVNLSAGSALIDGLQADIKSVGPVGFTVMGGRDIKFGEEGQLTSHAYAAGVAAYLMGLKKTDLDISYFRAYDYSDVSRDIIGGSFKHYLAESIKLYANARYDLTAEVFNEVLGGIKYFPTLDLMFTAEYYQSYPTFDTTSIYSVFAVNKYKEALVKADYTVTRHFDVSAGYTHEDFDEGADADLYEVGLRYRPSVNMTIGLFHDGRSGYGGDLDGYKAYAEYGSLGKWKVAAGVDYDSYQRDDMTGQETAKRYWASGKYKFTKATSSSVRVEDNVNVNYDRDMQGRVTFDYDF
jgi:hypothetical protein